MSDESRHLPSQAAHGDMELNHFGQPRDVEHGVQAEGRAHSRYYLRFVRCRDVAGFYSHLNIRPLVNMIMDSQQIILCLCFSRRQLCGWCVAKRKITWLHETAVVCLSR